MSAHGWTCPECAHVIEFLEIEVGHDAAWALEIECNGCGVKAALCANIDPPLEPPSQNAWLISVPAGD